MSNFETLKRTTAVAGMSAVALVLAVGCGGSFGKARIKPAEDKPTTAEQTKAQDETADAKIEKIAVEKVGEEYHLKFDLHVLGQVVPVTNKVQSNLRQQRETMDVVGKEVAVSSQCLDAECKEFVTLVEFYADEKTSKNIAFKSGQVDGAYKTERVQNKYGVPFQNAFDITQYLADKDGWDERRKPMDPVKPLPDHVDETSPGTGGDQPIGDDREPTGDDRNQDEE